MNGQGRRVAIIDGCRTPFAKSGTDFRDVSAVELGKASVRELIARTEIDPKLVDHVVYGTVVQSVQEPNIAREVTLGAGIPPTRIDRASSTTCSGNFATSIATA